MWHRVWWSLRPSASKLDGNGGFVHRPLDLTVIPGQLVPLQAYGNTRVHHLPAWGDYSDPKRLEIIRSIAQQRGRDARIAKLAADIIRKAKVQPRDYKGQAASLLAWVQDPKNIYYLNEPGERLQDPIYTIKNGFGDCDDQAMVLCALFESVRLPWRLVISGQDRAGRKVRHVEGGSYPPGVNWAHIYCMVGDHAYHPRTWYYAEPTVNGVPLGWDIVDGDSRYIPEMDAKAGRGPKGIYKLPPFVAQNVKRRAYAGVSGYGDVTSSVSAAVAEEMDNKETAQNGSAPSSSKFAAMAAAITAGVAISVCSQLLLDEIRRVRDTRRAKAVV